MTLIDFYIAQLNDEAPRTRRVLERVPEGHDDWKPHEKSMPLGRLAMLVAQMPSWFDLIVNRDDLELQPAGGSNINQVPLRTAADLVSAHDKAIDAARRALQSSNDGQLAKPWSLLVKGNTVAKQPREIVVRDTFMHLSHHRAQLTVYLRLLGAPVPAIYGPSADDQTFA